jgi:outer membrane receptor protein involved in Fe transport
MKLKLLLFALLLCNFAYSQNTITGVVIDLLGNSLAGAKIEVVGGTTKTYSDFSGSFSIEIPQLPASLNVKSYGHAAKIVVVTKSNEKLIVALTEEITSLDKLVLSASRSSVKLLESPVSIQRIDKKEIKNTSSSTFYKGLENLNEVQINYGSFLHSSINTRGFATASNPRFMQLVDGMENTPPGSNVVIGNLSGLSQLDVESIEILPGASSALYGANAFNGILTMNSKSPFDSAGVTAYFIQGFTSQKAAGTNSNYDFGVRGAYKFSDKFAAKANLTYFKGTDWLANDERNVAVFGRELPKELAYNGLNLYGDEILKGVDPDTDQLNGNTFVVTRTAYSEKDLNDGGKVSNLKADVSLNWRPKANDFEIILLQKYSNSNSNYAAIDDRLKLKNFSFSQTKLEVKGKNFFFRNYLTSQNSGDTYSFNQVALALNEKAKNANDWFGDFRNQYIASTSTGIARILEARNTADSNRLLPGTPEFNNAFNSVVATDKSLGGALYYDRSSFFHSEGNYNFRDDVSFAEIQVGGSFRNYNLDSKGSIYADKTEKISFNEYGLYTQTEKKFLDDQLKVTGSVRYDKSQNFNGNFSPRISFSYSFDKDSQRNLRVSYQTGFRNPTASDQYSSYNVGPVSFVGGLQQNIDKYSEVVNTSVNSQFLFGLPKSITVYGKDVYGPTYTKTSVDAFGLAALSTGTNVSLLKAVTTELVKPETVKSYEIGYRTSVADYIFDINLYYNKYQNFIYSKQVVKPLYGDINNPNESAPGTINLFDPRNAVAAILFGDAKTFQVFTNSDSKVSSLGLGFGAEKRFAGYDVSFNFNHIDYSYDQNVDLDFKPGFNTPKNRLKIGLGNEKLFNNFGFKTNLRWSSEYLWESPIASATIPAVTVLDVQANYKINSLKTTLKIGANNLFGKDYLSVLGAGLIGQQYFISFVFNQ